MRIPSSKTCASSGWTKSDRRHRARVAEFGVSTKAHLNLRYLAGGSSGTSGDPDAGSDGYTENWLQFVALTIGATVR
jgi:hypothetical protein